MGSFQGRADDLINLRGIKMFPSQLEEVVRSIPGVQDEFEIVLSTNEEGLDVMCLRVEHADYGKADTVVSRLVSEVRTRCEVRVDVEVLAPDTLPKTQFKANRVKDQRIK